MFLKKSLVFSFVALLLLASVARAAEKTAPSKEKEFIFKVIERNSKAIALLGDNIYYFAEHGVLIRKADTAKYGTAVESLKDVMIGAQRGAIQVKLAKMRIKGVAEDKAEEPNAQVKELGKLPDLIMELKNSKVEAVVAELPVAKAYLGANSDLALASYTFKDSDGGSAVAVKKGDEALVAEINKSIARLTAAGKIESFVAEASEAVKY